MDNWVPCYDQPEDLIYHLHNSPLLKYDTRIQKKVTQIKFDEYSDLLWVGDSHGKVSSFYRQAIPSSPNAYHLYSRHSVSNYQIDPEPGVLEMVPTSSALVALTDATISISNRRGLLQAHFNSLNVPELTYGMRAMAPIDELHCNLLLGGEFNSVLNFDYSQGQVVSRMDYFMRKITKMKSNNHSGNPTASKLIFASTDNGIIDIIDTSSNKIVESFKAHQSSVSDFDVAGNTLVTVGKSKKFDYVSDPFVRVFDLRMIRDTAHVSFSPGADFVQLHPLLPSVVLTASRNGQFQFSDLFNPLLSQLYNHPGSNITRFEMSPNGEYISLIGKDYSNVHTWCRNGGNSRFVNNVLFPLEFADSDSFSTTRNKSSVDINDDSIALSSFELPPFNEKLLSAWPPTIFNAAGSLPPQVILENEEVSLDFLHPSSAVSSNTSTFSFGSIQNNPNRFPSGLKQKAHLLQGLNIPCLVPYSENLYGPAVPQYVSLKEASGEKTVKIEHLEWELTKSSHGLKLSQLVSPPLMFRKLNSPTTVNGQYPDFTKMNKTKYSGLLSFYDGSISNSLIQLYRFCPHIFPVIQEQLLGLSYDQPTLIHELGYLIDSMGSENVSKIFTPKNFNEMVKYIRKKDSNDIKYLNKLLYKTLNKETCQKLKLYFGEIITVTGTSSKKPADINITHHLDYALNGNKQNNGNRRNFALPSSMLINIDINDEEFKILFSKNSKWLSKSFAACTTRLTGQPVFKNDLAELPKLSSESATYELSGIIVKYVYNNDRTANHVAFVKIFTSETEYKWYMFNDFLVLQLSEEDVLEFRADNCRFPQIAVYTKKSELEKSFESVTKQVNEILCKTSRSEFEKEFVKLSKLKNVPASGSLLAMDSEFVMSSSKKYEVDKTGNVNVLQDRKMDLARISTLYGNSEALGKVLFDDYVVHKGHIEDYLTKYSGIVPGDLDPEKSNKPLIQRQFAFRKFWLLIKLGCIIVGHGLHNDFAGIGIYVAASQVRDTSVYFWQGGRYLSLRYLCYVLLEQDIQVGDHDSIEDAYTALILYRKYLELKANGSYEDVVDEIFKQGRAVNYKVPTEREAT
ncbi:hypothetical protein ACO0RG_003287 [Hanseniaspora osmophila]